MTCLSLFFLSFYVHSVFSASVAISRNDWTVSASSSHSGNEASKAIDGDSDTFWHSEYTPEDVPLPHWIVVDMKSTYNIDSVSYQPRQDSNANGRIGGHTIEVSTDGSNWGSPVALGSYYNDAGTKRSYFVAREARYVKFTATSEAQEEGNPWASMAELNVYHDPEVSVSAPEPSKGFWTHTVDFPIVPVAASLLASGKVVVWSAFARDTFGGQHGYTQTAIYDPSMAENPHRTVSHTEHDMFCPGISLTFDGRVVVTGGSDAARTSIYEPDSDAWVSAPNMKIARGYQSSTTCSDGRIFTIGGSWSGSRGGKDGEIYDPDANEWSLLSKALVSPMLTADRGGVWRSDNHAWLFGWKNQTVFQAGPSKAMNWYDTSSSSGSTTGAGRRSDDGDAMNGNAVMFDAVAGKILTAGGATNYEDDDARTNAYVITIGDPKTDPEVTKVDNMAHARGFANGVALPDGTVLVTGGQSHVKPFTDTTSAYAAELFDPSTSSWTQMNPMAIPRTYHSVAVLLPDATVFQAGGGLCGGCGDNNHFDAEIFVPPYLLEDDGSRRPRPVIASAPSSVGVGETLSVTLEDGAEASAFALLRFGTATHTVNTDQRRVPLEAEGSGGEYTMQVPGDAGVALPGLWLLFAMDGRGTPSEGRVVRITA